MFDQNMHCSLEHFVFVGSYNWDAIEMQLRGFLFSLRLYYIFTCFFSTFSQATFGVADEWNHIYSSYTFSRIPINNILKGNDIGPSDISNRVKYDHLPRAIIEGSVLQYRQQRYNYPQGSPTSCNTCLSPRHLGCLEIVRHKKWADFPIMTTTKQLYSSAPGMVHWPSD